MTDEFTTASPKAPEGSGPGRVDSPRGDSSRPPHHSSGPRPFSPRRFRKFGGGRRRKCTPCDPSQFDWKDVGLLSRFQTPTGKLIGRKRTGFCSQCQKKLSRAVKRARYMALIPYTT